MEINGLFVEINSEIKVKVCQWNLIVKLKLKGLFVEINSEIKVEGLFVEFNSEVKIKVIGLFVLY